MNDDPTNPDPNVRLDRGGWISGPMLDSEPWTCQQCGGQFIGQRTPDDLCGPCIALRLAAYQSVHDPDEIPLLTMPMTAGLLTELHPGWTIVRDEGLGAWTAEKRDGTTLHFLAAVHGWELSAKIKAAEQAGQ